MRVSIARFFAFLVIACVTAPVFADQDLILNGSFELPEIELDYEYVPSGSSIVGWDVLLPGVERLDPMLVEGAAQNGRFSIDLTSDFGTGGAIQQTMATKEGGIYVLTFYAGTLPTRGRNGSGHVEVMINGVTYSYTIRNPQPVAVWERITITFTANSRVTTVAFMNFDAPGTTFSFIDNVSLIGPPPDPIDPPPPADDDGDGFPDAEDECRGSDTRPTVIIGNCDSGVPNLVTETGCTLADRLAECAVSARNHGKYVSCVSYVTNQFKKADLITGAQKGAIESCAARSK